MNNKFEVKQNKMKEIMFLVLKIIKHQTYKLIKNLIFQNINC